MKKIVLLLGIIVLAILILFSLRFILGGSEDDWICVDGEWVKHGVPSAPMPTEPCPGKKQAPLNCQSYGVEDCPSDCVVCPPCIECSSISCQSEEFCASIGIDRDWYPNIPDIINSFDDCVLAGYPVMESYPRQCRTKEGWTFIEEID